MQSRFNMSRTTVSLQAATVGRKLAGTSLPGNVLVRSVQPSVGWVKPACKHRPPDYPSGLRIHQEHRNPRMEWIPFRVPVANNCLVNSTKPLISNNVKIKSTKVLFRFTNTDVNRVLTQSNRIFLMDPIEGLNDLSIWYHPLQCKHTTNNYSKNQQITSHTSWNLWVQCVKPVTVFIIVKSRAMKAEV